MQAASANKKAQRAQAEQQNMKFAMERRDSIRQMRIAQATAMARAENQGVGESSGATGGQGSILSQGASNIKFLDGSKAWADIAGSFMDKAAGHQANAAGWGALSSLAQIGMSFSPTPAWLQPANPAGATITPSPRGSAMTGMRNVANNMALIKRYPGF